MLYIYSVCILFMVIEFLYMNLYGCAMRIRSIILSLFVFFPFEFARPILIRIYLEFYAREQSN